MSRKVWLLATAILAVAWIVPTTSGYAERVLGDSGYCPRHMFGTRWQMGSTHQVLQCQELQNQKIDFCAACA